MEKKYITVAILFCVSIMSLLISGCQKEKNMFDNFYSGNLSVEYINAYPPWAVETTLIVDISTDGTVLITSGSLSYSGELILDDSKIVRSGSWDIFPEGHIEGGNPKYVVIDPGILVSNDITEVWAKDNYGTWVKVSETPPYNGPSGGVVTFSFDEAVTGTGEEEVIEPTGSIKWTLDLMEDI